MSLHESARWIVAYDISDARRGVKVHRLLKQRGVPLQYSVFVVEDSLAGMQALMREIGRLIAPHTDDVRAYRWPAQPEIHQLGPGMLPEDLLFSAHPVSAPVRYRRTKELT